MKRSIRELCCECLRDYLQSKYKTRQWKIVSRGKKRYREESKNPRTHRHRSAARQAPKASLCPCTEPAVSSVWGFPLDKPSPMHAFHSFPFLFRARLPSNRPCDSYWPRALQGLLGIRYQRVRRVGWKKCQGCGGMQGLRRGHLGM